LVSLWRALPVLDIPSLDEGFFRLEPTNACDRIKPQVDERRLLHARRKP